MALCDDFYVERISYKEAKPFILNIHYARRMPCVQYAYGLFEKGSPFAIGCVTYGQPASAPLCKGIAGEENRKNVLELNRLVLFPEYNSCERSGRFNNYASFLISHSLKMLPNHTFVVSYADCGDWGHVGYVYQATNWIYTGMTKARTDKRSKNGGHARHYKKGETERQERSAKHRYVFLVGTPRQKKKMLSELRYQVYTKYPKGDSSHYDVYNPQSNASGKR